MQSRPAHPVNLVIEELGKEVVAFDTETGRTVVLNPVAGAVLELSDGTHTVEEIGAFVRSVLPADEAQVQSDTLTLLTELEGLGLITYS